MFLSYFLWILMFNFKFFICNFVEKYNGVSTICIHFAYSLMLTIILFLSILLVELVQGVNWSVYQPLSQVVLQCLASQYP